jgi:hypothetical protein
MNITRSEQISTKYNLEQYRLEQALLQKQRENDYSKVVEQHRFERTMAERVSRNLRLDLDKGRNIDIEC